MVRGRARFTIDGEDVDAPAGTVVFIQDPAVKRVGVRGGGGHRRARGRRRAGPRVRGLAVGAHLRRDPAARRPGAGTRRSRCSRRACASIPANPSLLYNLACAESQCGPRRRGDQPPAGRDPPQPAVPPARGHRPGLRPDPPRARLPGVAPCGRSSTTRGGWRSWSPPRRQATATRRTSRPRASGRSTASSTSRAARASRGAGACSPKDTSLRLFSLGAYVGEVIRRDAGGEWEGDDDADGRVEPRARPGGRTARSGRCSRRRAMRNGAEDAPSRTRRHWAWTSVEEVPSATDKPRRDGGSAQLRLRRRARARLAECAAVGRALVVGTRERSSARAMRSSRRSSAHD